MADSLDMRRSAKGTNPFEEKKEEEEVLRTSTTGLLKEAKQVRESYQQPEEEEVPAGEMTGFSDLMEKIKEQEKTIKFQKAKIIALQTELEDTVKASGKLDSRFDELEKLNLKLTEENKKLIEKANASTGAQ